jgi:hypothetical protein
VIDRERLSAIIDLAEAIPERYREALFKHLLSREDAAPLVPPVSASGPPQSRPEVSSADAYASLLTESSRGETRLLAAIATLEGSDGVSLSDLPDLYKRYRVKPPANMSRDVSALIKKRLVIELSRDGRSPRVAVTMDGKGHLGRALAEGMT